MADSRLSCFFLGLGVGTAVGLLFASKPGDELIGDLRARASEGRDFLWQRSGELRHQAEEILERGRSNVATQREQFAAALEAGRRAYQEASSEETEMGDPS
jgi:gas vesicle protein